MSYVVDYALPAFKILLEEFNSENGHTLKLEDVTFSNFVAESAQPGRSSIRMTCNNPEHGVGSVELFYVRMSLAYVFSRTGITAKDFDWDVPYDTPAVNERLLANLFKRYKIPFDMVSYDFVKRDGSLYVIANDKNMLFAGEVKIDSPLNMQVAASVRIPDRGPRINIVEVIRVNPKL